jgi:DNA-binding CsgD family transcriptional regulator
MKPSKENSGKLTAREKEVLRLVADGLTNEEVADRLCLSTNTVRAHLYSVFCKLGVGTRGAAVRIARQHGIIEGEWAN